MKPTLSYLIPTVKALHDPDTSMWSYIDVFASLNISKQLDHAIQTFIIMGRIINAPAGTAEVTVYIHDPNGKLFGHVNMGGPVSEGDIDLRAEFKDVIFTIPGKYKLSASFNGKKLTDGGRYYFMVKKDDSK
jgi:hypothetical protein